ncbi:hypothetical protein HK102_007198 [Quaeritorhiza haematococci]|nr:hypothetical protein HK102_007198 [Quaeritorhiza haematococci]
MSVKSKIIALFAFFLTLTIFASSGVTSLPTPSESTETSPSSSSPSSDSDSNARTAVALLGREYKRLRTLKGFFDGAEERNPDIDDFNGLKHTIMRQLQEYVVVPGNEAQRVVELMGVPDRVGLPEDVSLDQDEEATSMPKVAGDYWVYKWRGLRDFMWVFVGAMDESVVASGWHMTLV